LADIFADFDAFGVALKRRPFDFGESQTTTAPLFVLTPVIVAGGAKRIQSGKKICRCEGPRSDRRMLKDRTPHRSPMRLLPRRMRLLQHDFRRSPAWDYFAQSCCCGKILVLLYLLMVRLEIATTNVHLCTF